LTLDEVRAKYTGALVPNVTRRDLFLEETPTKLPVLSLNHRLQARADASKDWRQYGVVTTPKNQGGCGSCTDFAVTGGLEAAMGLYKGVKNLDLSEQELVDCPTGNGVARCSGNWPEDIYDYQKNQGQTTEAQYPYEAKEGSCRASGKSKPARISNWYRAPNSGDENQLKEWVSTYGPHSVVIEVNNAFQSYRGGVMDSPCSNTRYDHSVLVVGYGSENGKDFWIVKNSWGTGYGEKGYIRMARNKGNLCRIADYGILPQA
jgi:C1A family cysteine protease